MAYLRLSLLILLTYFSISCFNTQDLNARLRTIEPYGLNERPDVDIVIEEELPEIDGEYEIVEEDLLAYDFFSFEQYDDFSKVGLLLPLSGSSKNIGESMLKAAEMALFDSKNSNIELIIEDTKGTDVGLNMAAQLAISKGAQVILGPVFSGTTQEMQKIAKTEGINILSFSNNWELANKNTFLMGFMPYYQIMEILNYAGEKGYKKLAVILPNGIYGDLVEEILELNRTMEIVKIERLPGDITVQEFIQEFSGYNDRKKSLETEVEFYSSYLEELAELDDEINNKDLQQQMSDDEFFFKYSRYKDLKSIEATVQKQLEILENQVTTEELDFDCILLPFGGDKLREIASLLSYYDIPPETVKYLGTGLFDDKSLNDEPALVKAWYAAPYSKELATFEKRYKETFEQTPIRIASIAYDAISLLSLLSDKEEYPDNQSLTKSSGFKGIDGVFKFNKNGLIERELSIMEIQKRRSPKRVGP